MSQAAENLKKNNRNRAQDSSGKVVQLFEEASRSCLTELEQEEMVLEFRIKARKLARSILRKWRSRLDLEEVDSVVDLSLCEAVKRFDPDKGASFLTFLYYHLKGNLVRTVSAAANANLIPGANSDSDEEQQVHAYDVAEALTSVELEKPDEMLLKKELINLSQNARDRLDPLEQEVIHRIYLEGQNLIDIASSLGYSRCHISRVKKKALETLNVEISASMSLEQEDRDVPERKVVHRRKPRSKKSREKLEDVLEAA